LAEAPCDLGRRGSAKSSPRTLRLSRGRVSGRAGQLLIRIEPPKTYASGTFEGTIEVRSRGETLGVRKFI
jgi:hypothetical protein